MQHDALYSAWLAGRRSIPAPQKGLVATQTRTRRCSIGMSEAHTALPCQTSHHWKHVHCPCTFGQSGSEHPHTSRVLGQVMLQKPTPRARTSLFRFLTITGVVLLVALGAGFGAGWGVRSTRDKAQTVVGLLRLAGLHSKLPRPLVVDHESCRVSAGTLLGGVGCVHACMHHGKQQRRAAESTVCLVAYSRAPAGRCATLRPFHMPNTPNLAHDRWEQYYNDV